MVKSLPELKDKFDLQMAEVNSINTVDDFLDKSRQSREFKTIFGTRREHSSTYTLRDYLRDNKLLDDFLAIV